MADVTDTVLTLTLAAVDASAPAMTAFNARLVEQKAMLDASNAKMAEASAVQDTYVASTTRMATASRSAGAQAEAMAVKQAAASDKETAAAIKEAETRVAQSQRILVAEARQYEQEAAGVARVAAAREAADARAVKSAELASTRAAASWDKNVLKMAKAGTVVGGIGVAFEAMGAKSVVSLDTAEHHVEAFTNAIGNGANQVPLAKMRAEIQALADQTGISAAKITEGFYNIASSGLSADKSLAVLTESTKFAKASQTDAAVASGLLTAVTNAYHLSLAGIKTAQDDITQATKQGTMEARDYAPSLAQIIPVAAHLGVGLKELGAWYTVLTNNGISAAESGVYVGNMLNQILAPTYQQVRAVTALGGSYNDLVVHNGNATATLAKINDLIVKAVPDVKSLENAHGDLSKRMAAFVEQLSHADGKVRALFGGNMEAAKAFFSIMANGGTQTSAAMRGMQTDAGATDRSYKIAMTSMANQFDLAKQAADHLARELSGPMVEGLLVIAKDAKPAASGLAGLAHDHKTLTDILDVGLVALLGTSVAVRGLKYVAEPLIDVLSKLAPAAKFVGSELNTMRLATLASTEGAVGMRIAIETLGPRFAAVAGAVVVYDIATGHLTDTQKSAGAATDLIAKAYAQHKISLQQATNALHDIAHAYPGTLDAQHALYSGTLLATRAAFDHAQKLRDEAKAAQELGDKLNYAASIMKSPQYKNLLGPGTVPLQPNGSASGGGGSPSAKSPAAANIENDIKTVDAQIVKWGEIVYNDRVTHSASLQADTQKLNDLKAKSTELHKEWTDLTTTSVKLKTVGLDPFQKGFQKAQAALQSATDAIALDKEKGIPVSAAQRRAFDDATAAVKRYQQAQDDASGVTAARAAAREAAADKKQQAYIDAYIAHGESQFAKWDAAIDKPILKAEALARAADKAAAALLKVAHDALSKPGAEGAETAQRVGQLNAQNGVASGVPQPGDYKTEGAWEAAQAAYFKKHAEDFYHNNPTALRNTSGQELKVEGVTPAQLLADPVVKKYLETLTEQKLKALGFTPGQLKTIPGTTEWQNAQPWAGPGPAGFPGARFGQVGQPGAAVPSIANLGSGFAGTVGGIIAGGIKLRDTFELQVQAGLDQIKTGKEAEKVSLEVAKRSGDTATVFSILDKQYLDGRATLAQVDQAYKDNQVTVLASTRRLIDFDRATGNTADEFTQLQTLYHQGNASLAELTQAYDDNQAAVAKATAADLAFYVATGQFSAAMSSISTSLTGPLGDASAKLAYDFYTHSGNIEADTQSVKDHQAALDALTQATWDASYTAANPAQQSQMLNSLAQPMISAQAAQASSEQAVANAQLGVIAANSALEVAGINAMTTQIQDMGGIIKAESAVSTARFSGQLAALNDLIPIQNDLYAITKATNPQMLQTAQEQLKIDRLTAVMDQDKAVWDVKLAQMQLQLAQDKMAVDAANASAQMTVAFDNLTVAEDALNVAVAQAKLQSDSLVIQNAIHTDLGGVQDYLSLIDGDLQNLSAAQDQQMADQQQLGFDTGTANEIAAGGAGLLAGDQLGIDQATASAAASNQAYQLQLAQYKVEQNQQNLQQQLVNNQQQDNASLLSEIKTLQGIIAFQNSPAGRRPLRSVGNVSTAQLINGWAATAASTQAA